MDYPTLIKNITNASFFNDERAKVLLDYTKNNCFDETLFIYLPEIINLFSKEIRIQVLKFLLEKINCKSTKYLIPQKLTCIFTQFSDVDKVIAAQMLEPFCSEIPLDYLYIILLNSQTYNELSIVEITEPLLNKTNSINGGDICQCMSLFKMDNNKINFLNITCRKTTFSEIDVAKILDSFVHSNHMTRAFTIILEKSKNFTLDDDNVLFICRSLKYKFRNAFINTLVKSPKNNGGTNIKNTLPHVLICSTLSKYLDRDTYMSYIDKYIKTRENVDDSICDIFRPDERSKMDEDILIQPPLVDNWINVLKKSLISQGHRMLSETITIHDSTKTTIIVFSNGSNVIYSEKI
ncbi:hypothetical protein QJ854_gp882 [Moumouvirus goulette]|uniref:Uncharacterized protein n=1 Tax=Moumouvirus goulette TaxID=1247379 RepID=M1NLM3_9VIRU|nr:hypothetical protein QJ854_gp882 [Moumouvirus goulette]AGF84900.1 hypothetical protein glt_00091 [Moumouvirus goulette]